MTDTQLWWATLGAGLVVLAVAVILLHTLLRAIDRIQRELEELWAEAGRAAANTATSWLLEDTHAAVRDLEEELSLRRQEESRP